MNEKMWNKQWKDFVEYWRAGRENFDTDCIEFSFEFADEIDDFISESEEQQKEKSNNRVWIIYELKENRYGEEVIFYGVATSEEERDRISYANTGATVTEIPADTDALVHGADLFSESPRW